jgi:hypothetical protein
MAFGISAGTYLVAGAALAGGAMSASASKSAAKTQANAADNAAQLNMDQFNITRADQAPWRQAGQQALSTLSTGLNPGGEFDKPFTMADYTADPGYQFRLSEGQKGIQRSAAVTGGMNSGAVLKALDRFNSDQASQEFGNAYSRYEGDLGGRYSRLAQLAGLGQSANASTGALGQAATSGAAGALQDSAAATASGTIGATKAINGTLSSLYNNYAPSLYNTSGYAKSGAVDNTLF